MENHKTKQPTAKKRLVNDVKKQNQTQHVKKVAKTFIQIVKNIADPRERHCDYPLHEILFIAIVAVMCGAQHYTEFETGAVNIPCAIGGDRVYWQFCKG